MRMRKLDEFQLNKDGTELIAMFNLEKGTATIHVMKKGPTADKLIKGLVDDWKDWEVTVKDEMEER